MNLDFRKTAAVAKDLGEPYYRLMSLIRYELIAPPVKDTSGDYLWTDADVAAARAAFAAPRSRRRPRQRWTGTGTASRFGHGRGMPSSG